MAVLSIVVFIVALIVFIVSKIDGIVINEDVKVEGPDGSSRIIKREKNLNFLQRINSTLLLSIMGGSFIVWLLSVTMFFALPGKQYFVVSTTGAKTAITTEGIKFIMPFSKLQEWDKYIDVRVASESMGEDALKELEGIMSPVGIRFVDQVTANTYPAVRFKLPSDPEIFIAMAIKYRSVTNLVNNTLIPTIKEQLLNTGYMFSAQDYISGEAQNFRQTFEEMLKDGAYKVKKITILDTINDNLGQIVNIKTSYKVEKVLKNGMPIRIPTEITSNNIIVSQVILDKVDLNKAFKKRLEAQRDESAKRQLEEQKVKTAKTTQQRIIAEGESRKAEEKVSKEVQAISILVAEKTKLTQEETKRQLAIVKLKTAKIEAQTIKVAADADAYTISIKVKAGITPKEELQMRLDADVKKFSHLAKTNWPNNYTVLGAGGGKGGSTPLESIITAAMARQIIVNPKTK